MTEVPLHKAAANNHVEVLKYLLEWNGAEKPELEARNMVHTFPSNFLMCQMISCEAVSIFLHSALQIFFVTEVSIL